jgi:hypothetical protein
MQEEKKRKLEQKKWCSGPKNKEKKMEGGSTDSERSRILFA